MAERPAQGDGVEITPEMIEAGVSVLNAFSSDEYRGCADEELVERIWLQMWKVAF